MAEVDSPLSVVSRRLEEKKRNVAEQLSFAEEYVKSLYIQRDGLISKLEEECKALESEVSLLKKALDNKTNALLEELRSRSNLESTALSLRIEVAKEAISGTTKVSLINGSQECRSKFRVVRAFCTCASY